MKDLEYLNIYRQDGSHFFYVTLYEEVERRLKIEFKNKGRVKILDAGCGVGGLSIRLNKWAKVTACDYSPEALKWAKKRGVKASLASIDKLPYQDNSFDAVVCLDVLYHAWVTDRSRAIAELTRVLKPGGIIVLRTAANQELFSNHDLEVMTSTRLSRADLTNMIKQNKLKIERLSFCQSYLYLPALMSKIRKLKSESGVKAPNKLINNLMIAISRIEYYLIRWVELPIGIGLFAVLRKS